MAMVASARRLIGIRTFVYTRPSEWKQALKMVRDSGLRRRQPR
jgi:hypothetical protein